jgi:hypothetical protein
MDIPQRFHKLFWDVSPANLQWQEHKYFIIARFLNFGTIEALQWLEQRYRFMAEMPALLNSTHARKLDKKTLNFWKQYFDLNELPWETETYKRLRKKFWVD